MENKDEIYLAAPFFRSYTDEHTGIFINERSVVSMIKDLIERTGYRCYSPMHECELKPNATALERAKTFGDNLAAIQRSRFLVVVTDGKDTGTIWEAGYSFGKDKSLVYFCQTLGNRPFNLMLAESAYAICTTYTELTSFLLNPRRISYEGLIQ